MASPDGRLGVSPSQIPLGLALSGGGSRAMAFHLGCLRALDQLGVLRKVGVLSTISGGSVIGAYYAYTPQKSFAEFDSDIRGFLRKGFERRIGWELAKPHNFVPCLASFLLAQAQEALAYLAKIQPKLPRYMSRTDMFCKVLERDLFTGITLCESRRRDLEIVIGACELRVGEAFRFGNRKTGGWRHGELTEGNLSLAFAVAASASYPIFLPAFDRTWRFKRGGIESDHRVVLTDGGIYDNLGMQVLEPGRDPRFSLHTFPCKNLIICNAGQGQEAGAGIPMGFLSRVRRSFEVVHRRVQDNAMNRLHHLKASGVIDGFALPYLGQQDSALPGEIEGLISREEVIGYPTNFAAMSEEWIKKLSRRGEQMTRTLVSHYLPNLLSPASVDSPK
jgi:NTE family protein